MLEHLQEDPLRPLVVVGIGGVYLAVVVKGEAQHLQLFAEVLDVLLGDFGGMDVILDGEVFGGQTKSVPADGMEHIVALHALFAGNDVQRRIGAGMADVQAGARGIGELDQSIELGLGVIVGGGKGLVVQPDFLPLFLNARRIVHGNFAHGDPPSNQTIKPPRLIQRRNGCFAVPLCLRPKAAA